LDQNMSITTNRRLLCLVLAILTIAAGLLLRLVPLGLSLSIYKYGGSALWAVMVYWLVALAFPKLSPLKIAFLAALIAASVEFFRLYHTPALDSFRLTLAGRLLLGATSSPTGSLSPSPPLSTPTPATTKASRFNCHPSRSGGPAFSLGFRRNCPHPPNRPLLLGDLARSCAEHEFDLLVLGGCQDAAIRVQKDAEHRQTDSLIAIDKA
jgi:hypothetical protein